MQTEIISGFGLAPQQKRLWNLQHKSSIFCSQASILIEGNLQPDILQKAIGQVVNHHDILRTSYDCLSEVRTPVMVVADKSSFHWNYLDLSDLLQENISTKIHELFWEARQEYQKLSQAYLLRFCLTKLLANRHILIVSLPALSADTRTMKNLANQISQAYTLCCQGKSLSGNYVQYVHFSEWQNQLLEDADAEAAKKYWQQQKITSLSALQLPNERQGKSEQFITDSYQLAISQELSDKIYHFAQKYDQAPEIILLACWQLLIWRLIGESEIIIGTASDRRDYEELYEVLGLLATWLPIKTRFIPKLNFIEVLASVTKTLEDAAEWQDYFVSEAVEHDNLIAFPIGFEFEKLFETESDDTDNAKVTFALQDICSFIEPFKVKLTCLQRNNSFIINFYYDMNCFSKETIQRLAKNFQTLLINTINNSNIPIEQIEILSVSERRQLLVEFNQTKADYGRQKCIHQLFEEQVEKTPDQIAVVFENEELTYAELNFKSNQLARYLQKLGVKAEIIVGICVERSPKFIISLLAVLKAGGAYLPLDPALPQEALQYRLQDAQASLLISDWVGTGDWGNSVSNNVNLDSDWEKISCESTEDLINDTKPENLVYIIYTSGSTGTPKGVAVEHQQLFNYLYGILPKLQLPANANYASVSTFAADLGNTVIFPCLCNGGCLYIVSWECASDPIALASYFRRHPIDCLKIVPSHLAALLSSECWEILPRQLLILGGETANWDLIEKIEKNVSHCRILNHYGPTETTVGVLTYSVSGKIQETGTVPIGKPLANTQVYILDAYLQPVPLGITGELYIGGESLARGYLNQSELTAERFITNPFGDAKQRLYKTGDRVRYLSDGNIEFLGRLDDQVKIRGYRIELGEISTALSQHPAVRESIVIAREEIPGEKHLVAYIVLTSHSALDHDFRNFLKVKLPEYMIPTSFVILKALPLTANGKLDRNALPAPEELVTSQKSFIAPRTPIEEVLASIWIQLLGVGQVSIDDNFFDLGGHSLLATQVISRIRTTFGIEMLLPQLFESANLAVLAAQIEIAMRGQQQEITTITPAPRDKHLPLSFAQQRLWFFDQFEPGSPLYNLPRAVRLQGKLNINLLLASLNEIIRRHEVLRTSFALADGQPIQVIFPSLNLQLPVVDLKYIPQQQREAELYRLAKEEAQTGFDITQAPLLRAKLLQLDTEDNVILLTFHHIVSDGWSTDILIREVATLYTAFCAGRPSPLPQLPIQYADFALWQRKWLEAEALKNQLAYWQKQLSGELPILQLPTDRPRPAVQTYVGKTLSFVLPTNLSEGLKSLSKQEGVTLFMTLLAAFKTLLYRYTGQTDILVGCPIANRNRAEIENLIGFFVNTLVLRSNLSGNPTFRDLLKQVRQVALGAYAHQDLPFEKLVEEIQPERNLSYSPLFQIMFVLQNAPMGKLELTGLRIKPLENNNTTAKFDLTLEIEDDVEQGLIVNFEYNTNLFDEITILHLAANFEVLLKGIVTNPQQYLCNLPLLTTTEKQQLLEWSQGKTNLEPKLCIHKLFEAQVEGTPDEIAVEFENQQLSYQELNQRANQLAHYLQELGVKPEVLVGICVERSLDMVIGLLAILKAGGAYVPLDPSYPKERIAFILEDTQATVLLTQASLVEAMPQHQAIVVCLDADWHFIAQQSQENLFSQLTTDNLAYVIYTSGSTGKPKGVQISHAALSNFLYSMKQTPGLTDEDILLAVTTYSFDIAALELFLPIIVGVRLVVASREIVSDGTQLSTKLIDSKATVIQATPATWQLLLAAGWDGNHQLKILCGGEALPGHLANQLLERCDCLWNMYGPTETTIWSAASQVETVNNTVPISSPIANTQLYILDKYHQLVPVGVLGELCIGGEGLARGYFNRPDLTAEKFIPNPFSDKSARLYKTGDLARYLPNGDIEYIGRIDNQVKVRGFRIELGEIETLVCQYPGVREAVVAVHCSEADCQRVIAYVVSQKEQTLAIAELRSFLESKLPSYMVPAVFVTLEALPLTPNGKVDRKALPIPELTKVSSSMITPPSTPIENLLAGIWAEVLSIDKVGIDNNFFELGGHSLIATRVISQIRQVFKAELPLRYLFEKPTIAEFAKEIEKAIKVDSGVEGTNIERIERSQQLPISFAQQRLWFLAQLEPDSPFYNIPAAVRLQGQLNIEALQQSFNSIIRRHEALRTNFQTIEGQAVAVIREENPLTLSIFDISNLAANQQQVEVKQQAAQEAQQPFDISSDHLLRVKLLRLGEQEHIVLLTMHHIVSDGWSIGVLVEELVTFYQAFCDGQSSPLPPLPIQYVDFAAWQRQWLQGQALETQLAYWLKQLENAPKVLELPTDYPRPAIQTFRGATYSFELSKELSASLNKLSQQQGSTLFMTLLAGFQILLCRYTGQNDIVVGSPIANRNRTEIEGLIGCFVNTLALRTNLAGNPSFEELLKRMREVALGAYAHQDLPFELLVEKLQPERDLSHTPLFQVMFVLQNAPIPTLELPGLTLTPLESDSDSAKFDLTLNMTETEEGLVGSLEYNTDLFEESSIQRMAGHLQTLLGGIVANPQQPLSELSLLTKSEQHQLLWEWNNTEIEYAQQQSIHQLFEAQVERTPDAIAVVFKDQQLTYCELNTKANQLAHYLQKLGLEPEVLVGICVERSLLMVIGLLAILKAGGAYVPFDSSYPRERLVYMLEDSQPGMLLTQQDLLENLPTYKAQVIFLDSDWELIAHESTQNPTSNITYDNLAYVIYTSGSTGKPKGVMNTHRGIHNRLMWMQDTYHLTATDTVLQKTPFSFDVSVWEFFWTLITGARLVIAQPEGHRDTKYLVNLILQQQITTLHFVPSMMQVFIEAEGLEKCQSLVRVIVSGEALPAQLQQRFFNRLDAQLHNLYGPTEAAVDVTFWQCKKDNLTNQNTVPIGRPIANIQIYLLDKYLNPVAVGVTGEVYIGGVGVGRGYLNRPDLTAEKFIPDPFSKQAARLYKTGDLARYLPTGDIEYIGRTDHQVKIRGFRIELGEIEATLRQYPAMRQVLVTVHLETDSQRLVAYIVPHTEQTLVVTELRSFLESRLPNYMMPTAFVILDALPLTPNGKVDRKALPAPDTARPKLEAVYQPPQTEVEKTITDVWQEVLNVENVGIDDNFFELGGHSLLLVQVHSKLQIIFQQDFPLIEMFQYPTVNHLAKYLSHESSEKRFMQHSNRPETRVNSVQRRKQVRQEYRAARKQREQK